MATNRASELLENLEIRDYLRIGRRRWQCVALPTIAAFIIAAVVSARMPNIYQSQTVILVDPQKVPDNFVASIVSGNVADRLTTIRQEVMSPTRLVRLIDKVGLYKDLRGKVSDQILAQRMQNAITVDVAAQSGRQLSTFEIAFRGTDPGEVALVANQLAAMFIEEEVNSRQQQSTGTTEFLDNELAKTKQDLDVKEAELRDIKGKYIMDLPDSKQFHVEALDTLRRQIDSAQERISRAQRDKAYLQSVMPAPTVDLDATGENASPYRVDIERLESKVSEMQARYGPKHPDLRKLQGELDALRAKEAKEKANWTAPAPAPAPKRPRNPVLEAQVAKLDDEIRQQTRSQADLQQQVNFHMSKLERIPIFEQRIAGLMRDYDILRTHYSRLLDKKLSADMSSSLETRQKGERFIVLDAARVADRPISPNRRLISLGGLILGMIMGAALTFVMEFMDESVRNRREAAKLVGAEVLVGVPQIRTREQRRASVLRGTVAVAATAASSVVAGFAGSFILSRLM